MMRLILFFLFFLSASANVKAQITYTQNPIQTCNEGDTIWFFSSIVNNSLGSTISPIISLPTGNLSNILPSPLQWITTNVTGNITRFKFYMVNQGLVPGSAGGFTVVYSEGSFSSSPYNHTFTASIGVAQLSTNNIVICQQDGNINLEDFQITNNGKWFNGTSLLSNNEFNPLSSANLTENLYYRKQFGQCVDIDTLVCVINENPVIVLTVVNDASCANNIGEIASLVNPNENIVSFNWMHGGLDMYSAINLSAGTYVLRVANDQGCKATAVANIAATDLQLSQGIIQDVTCFGGNNGSISPNYPATGGPFSYLWSNGASSPNISNLTAGNYSVTVTNSSGCQVSKTFVVTQSDEIEFSINKTQPLCGGGSNGYIDLNLGSNAIGSNVLWSAGSSMGNSVFNCSAGIYTVTVTNLANCVKTATVVLSEQGGIPIQAEVLKPDCGSANGGIDVTPVILANELSVLSITWEDNSTNEDRVAIGQGAYICTLVASNNCKTIQAWEVKTKRPAMNEICLVTVDSATTTNIVVWEKLPSTTIDHYNVYREAGVTGIYQKVGEVPYSSISVFNDVIASAEVTSWRYKIAPVDVCNVEGFKSPRFKTMNINVDESNPALNFITWDEYEGSSTVGYLIWKRSPGNAWTQLNATPTAMFQYTDATLPLVGADYYIETILNLCLPTVGKANRYNSSRSNRKGGIMSPGEGTGEPSNGLIELGNNVQLSMFPNPATSHLLLDLSESIDLTISIYTATGQIIEIRKLAQGTNTIDLVKYSNGLYYIAVETENAKEVRSFIKN